MRTLRTVLVLATLAAAMASAADRELLRLAPAGTRFLAGVQVDQGKITPFGRFLLSRMEKDDKEFQAFVTATGFDPTRDVDEILVAASGAGTGHKDGVMLARGHFNIQTILASAKEKGAVVTDYQGVPLLSPPKSKTQQSGAVAFLNGSIAIAGDVQKVKSAIAQRTQTVSLDPALEGKAAELSAAHHAWMVSVVPVAEMAGRVPDTNMSGAMKGNAFQAIEQISGGADFTDGVKIFAEAVTRSDKDATALTDVVRFLANLAQMNREGVQAPGLAAALETLDLKTEGKVAKVSFRVPEAQLEQ
ncbi:MAG: hypothetical protein ABFD86_15260, partial [Bryobacteraceae bacterium]